MIQSLSADYAQLLDHKTVYCGFSGGADSLTLLLLLYEAQEAFHFTLNAIHFEHGLRGRAGEEDARFCQKICADLKIPFTCITLNVPEHLAPGEGVEAAARRLRIAHWKQLPPESIIALGHNANDKIENLFLRLMRGSNTSALTSFSEFNHNQGITIIRPLLSYTRKQITDFLQGRGLQWRTDATNLEADYGRNFLRNKILPLIYQKFPYAEDGLSRALLNLQADASFIESHSEKTYAARNFTQCRSWRSLPDAIFYRVFRRFLSETIGSDVIPGHVLIDRFKSELRTKKTGQGYSELNITGYPDYSLFIGNEDLFLLKKEKINSIQWNPLEQSEINLSNMTIYFSRNFIGKGDGIIDAVFAPEAVKQPLLLRNTEPGDQMIPFGKHTPVLVRKLLSDASIPAPLRDYYPVLCDYTGEIIWIPGVKRSAKYPAQNSDSYGFSFSQSLISGKNCFVMNESANSFL